MSYITNYFRSRQRDTKLFGPPFSAADRDCLLAGVLPAASRIAGAGLN